MSCQSCVRFRSWNEDMLGNNIWVVDNDWRCNLHSNHLNILFAASTVIKTILGTLQLQTPINMLLVCLSFADFLMAAFGSPLTFTSAAYGKWTFGEKACKFYAFGMALGGKPGRNLLILFLSCKWKSFLNLVKLYYFSLFPQQGITSITTLMALAFQRFLMIARPFRAADIQKQHSVIYVTFIWLYSFALTFPPLVGWASYGPEAAYIRWGNLWLKRLLMIERDSSKNILGSTFKAGCLINH